jgi:hypothetical protein
MRRWISIVAALLGAGAHAAVAADTAPPTIQATVTPAPNTNGWSRTNVTVRFACIAGGSKIVSCPSAVVVSAEDPHQVISGTVRDQAGNTATVSVTLNIDKTPPVATGTSVPPVPAGGWSSVPVTVSFSATDAFSGVDPPSVNDFAGGLASGFGVGAHLRSDVASSSTLQFCAMVYYCDSSTALDCTDVGGAVGGFDAPAFNIGPGSVFDSIRNNLFMNFIDVTPSWGRAIVSAPDDPVSSPRVTRADDNAWFNPLAPDTIRYLPGIVSTTAGIHDVIANPRLASAPEMPYRVSEGCLWTGHCTIGSVLAHHRTVYGPSAGSPVVNAAIRATAVASRLARSATAGIRRIGSGWSFPTLSAAAATDTTDTKPRSGPIVMSVVSVV